MRHRVKKSFFNRGTKHRQAMLRNGVRNLILHGEIMTTKAKAKEFGRWTDKMIFKAMENSVASRRQLHQFFGKRDIVNTLVDEVAPVFKDRKSGFTRIVKYGRRRGDNTEMFRLELVVKPENLGTFKKPVVEKKPAKIKKVAAKKTSKTKPTTAKVKKESTAKKKTEPKKSKKTKTK
jgi:large subunit ribosomal protein L17